MRWILWATLVLVGVVGAIAIIGWLLPVGHEASRTSRFDQSPQRVYDVVADVGDYARWFEGVTRIEMLDSANGKVRFREHTTGGPVTMEVVEARPPSRFVTRIAGVSMQVRASAARSRTRCKCALRSLRSLRAARTAAG